MSKPCYARHPEPRPRCWFCWLAANDRRRQRQWGLPETAPEPRATIPDWVGRSGKTPTPCLHRGPELSGPERQAAGVGHARRWFRCELGLSVGGSPPGVVCACKGCGPRCPSYTPGAD